MRLGWELAQAPVFGKVFFRRSMFVDDMLSFISKPKGYFFFVDIPPFSYYSHKKGIESLIIEHCTTLCTVLFSYLFNLKNLLNSGLLYILHGDEK